MGVSQKNWGGQRRNWRDRTVSRMKPGLKHGFRSGLEKMNAEHLEKQGVPVLFELLKIPYLVPEKVRKYTPDFELPNGIIIETKGKLEMTDRAKHLFVKTQHPDLDIRFVFQRPHDPIYKGSRTTYAMWADKYEIPWATRVIPIDWINEKGPKRKPAEVLKEGAT